MLAAYIARAPGDTYRALRERVPWGALSLLSAIAAVGSMVSLGLGASLHYHHFLDFPVGLMTVTLLVASSRPVPALSTRIFGWRPLVFIGTFSYSLYLVHAPLLQMLWKWAVLPLGLGFDAQFLLFMTAGLAVVLAASYGFHLLFEAPFMRSPALPRRAAPSAVPTA
jgi:peptidoglycan/LPS O-acetylase OafA/YrhL